MAEERVQRRLAAILAADVAGYSRIMGEDEAGTRARFNAHIHELIEPAIADRQGRIVKTTGDALLVEFVSVVDAVQCAVDIQKGMAERNADEPDDRRMEFRIGVNLGDVIIEGDDIHGDGVNVAARLEGLAAAGGICVSGDVYRQCRGKLDVGFDDLGEQAIKNIAEPVRVYSVAPEGAGERLQQAEPADPLPLPDKPSIAILAFNNMSDDPGQEYFADGIAEDVITALSRFHSLFVIARNSSFTYKGRAVDIALVARELGVRYVVEGSVRKAGNRVRVTAQLIDATSGNHLWAERYDRGLDDIFEVQDEITEHIVTTVVPAVERVEQERSSGKLPDSMSAWDYLQRGRWHIHKVRRRDLHEARTLFRRVIEIDPRSPLGYIGVADTAAQEATVALLGPDDDIVQEGFDAAKKAVEIDDLDAEAHYVLGWILLIPPYSSNP